MCSAGESREIIILSDDDEEEEDSEKDSENNQSCLIIEDEKITGRQTLLIHFLFILSCQRLIYLLSVFQMNSCIQTLRYFQVPQMRTWW